MHCPPPFKNECMVTYSITADNMHFEATPLTVMYYFLPISLSDSASALIQLQTGQEGVTMVTASHLVPPLVDDGHVDVVHEHSHLPASWRAICAAHTLVNIALNGSLGEISRQTNKKAGK